MVSLVGTFWLPLKLFEGSNGSLWYLRSDKDSGEPVHVVSVDFNAHGGQEQPQASTEILSSFQLMHVEMHRRHGPAVSACKGVIRFCSMCPGIATWTSSTRVGSASTCHCVDRLVCRLRACSRKHCERSWRPCLKQRIHVFLHCCKMFTLLAACLLMCCFCPYAKRRCAGDWLGPISWRRRWRPVSSWCDRPPWRQSSPRWQLR